MSKRPSPPAHHRKRRRRPEDDAKTPTARRSSSRARTTQGPKDVDPRQLLHELDVYRTELEMQNEELRLAREGTEAALTRYTSLFDFAPVGYVVLALDGTIREVNHAAARLLGHDRSRLAGKLFEVFVVRPHQALYRSTLAGALDSGPSQHNADLDLLQPRQDVRHIALSVVALTKPDPSMLLTLEDISVRQAREQKLLETELTLRQADRRKDDFLATLSHELRNPLGPIRTSLSVLNSVGPLNERGHRARAIIDRQVTHLSRLVNDLLDLTRMAHGKAQLHRERLDLGKLVSDVVEDHRAMFEAADIRLELQSETGTFWMNGDADRLVQSVSNVLGNAQKFTPSGGSVVVSLQRANGAARLAFRDTGVGVDSQMLERMFEPFAQGPQGGDRPPAGLGLGLAVVKGIIQLHEGRVSVTSEGPGHGTEVEILLPLIDDILRSRPSFVAARPEDAGNHAEK